jgi:hypothetical protein
MRDSSPRSHDGRNVNDNAWVDAMRSVADVASAIARAWSGNCATRESVSWATERNHSPASVSTAGWAVRSTSTTPSHSSSARMRRLNAGCVMWRSSAAREKLPVAARARKSSSQRKFIADALGAWDQAEPALDHGIAVRASWNLPTAIANPERRTDSPGGISCRR